MKITTSIIVIDETVEQIPASTATEEETTAPPTTNAGRYSYQIRYLYS